MIKKAYDKEGLNSERLLRNFLFFYCVALSRRETLSKRPGGALGYFLGGYVPPGTPNWHLLLKRISPKTDTPF